MSPHSDLEHSYKHAFSEEHQHDDEKVHEIHGHDHAHPHVHGGVTDYIAAINEYRKTFRISRK